MSDRSLLELFEQLIRDPSLRAEMTADESAFFTQHGFGALGGLDDPIMAEAVTNVVAGFPPDVAEHFSDYTVAASPLPHTPDDIDSGSIVDLLESAPDWPGSDDAAMTSALDTAVESELLDGFGAGADAGETAEVPATDSVDDAGAAPAQDIEGSEPALDPLSDLEADSDGEPTILEQPDPMDLDEPAEPDFDEAEFDG